MYELTDLSLDAMRAEVAYRKDRLAAAGHRNHRPTRRWWQRLAQVPREHG